MAKSKQDIFMEVLLDSNLEDVAKDLAARIVKPVKGYFDGGSFPKGRNVKPRKKFTLEGCLGGYQMEIEYRLSNKGTHVFHATESFMSLNILNPESREGRMANFAREYRKLETEVADLVEHEMGHYYLGEMADAGECIYYTDPRGFAVYFEDPQEMVLHSKVVWNELRRRSPDILDRPIERIKFAIQRKVEELEWKVGVPGAKFPKKTRDKYVSLIMKYYVKPALKKRAVASELVRVAKALVAGGDTFVIDPKGKVIDLQGMYHEAWFEWKWEKYFPGEYNEDVVESVPDKKGWIQVRNYSTGTLSIRGSKRAVKRRGDALMDIVLMAMEKRSGLTVSVGPGGEFPVRYKMPDEMGDLMRVM